MSSTSRRLGLLQTISLVTGNLVGSGVFLLPASLALVGTLSLVGWVLTGCGALLLATVFASLSQTTQNNGGPHNYVGHAFGKEGAYWVAWGYWVLSWISNTALVVAAVSYLSPLLGGLSQPMVLLTQILIWGFITFVNIMGVQFAGRFELLMTTLKLIPLVAIPAIGLFSVDFQQLLPIVPQGVDGLEGIKTAMFLTLWAFVGLETATVTSGEVKNPKRTIPLATMIGTLIALFVYVLGSVVMLGVLGAQALSNSKAPYADLAGHLLGGDWGPLIAIAAVICCLGSFNGWTMVVSRISQGAATEGLFPSLFAKVDRRGTPINGLIISALCTLPLLFLSLQENLLSQFNAIIDISITLILMIYLFCILAYFKLKVGISNRLSAWIGIGALLFVLFALWAAGFKMVVLSLSLLVLGLPMRFYMRKQFAQDIKAHTPHLVSQA
ncbi:MAG: amino acid permease [Candidatus Berkiella sp.]